MTGLLRILVFILFGYILIKTVKFVLSVFKSIKEERVEAKIKKAADPKSKIEKKDKNQL